MKNTTSVRAVSSRLFRLSEKAHDLANAWWCGYSLNVHTWPSMADRCLRMHVHFLRKAERLIARRRILVDGLAPLHRRAV